MLQQKPMPPVMDRPMDRPIDKPIERPIGNTAGTILGEGIVFEGALIKGKGPIRIDGIFSGTINIEGHIVIGETGVVTGEVFAASAVFGGRYEGDLHVKNTLHITSTANLSGLIESGRVIIDEGAIIKGSCSIGNTERHDGILSGDMAQLQAAQHAKKLPVIQS